MPYVAGMQKNPETVLLKMHIRTGWYLWEHVVTGQGGMASDWE